MTAEIPLQPAITFEVEQKYPVFEIEEVESLIASQGIHLGEAQIQLDQYFAHPARSFAETDESLRMRCVGDEIRVTYKGPRQGTTAKTRREIELIISDGGGASSAARFSNLLQALGFTPVILVRKSRRVGCCHFEGRDFEISRDDVDSLGSFVEIETMISRPAEEDSDKDNQALADAGEAVHRLAREIGLDHHEPRTYLEMLIGEHKDMLS